MNARQSFIFKHFGALLTQYNGSIPFHHFFRKYCQKERSIGSRDRKILRDLIYRVFRCGPVWKSKPVSELFLGLALDAHVQRSTYFDLFNGLQSEHRLPEFTYPFAQWIPDELQSESYYSSLTQQPLLWIRLSRALSSRTETVKLNSTGLPEPETFAVAPQHLALGFPNNTAMDPQSADYEIQDISSQRVCSLLEINTPGRIWDCCCGSGGKTLYLTEYHPESLIFASDLRPRILENLHMRFEKRKLKVPDISVIDLTKPPETLNFQHLTCHAPCFDVVVADVPCSGSGTWAREPEHLTFFNPEQIESYAQKQYEIASNALKFLKPGGVFYYITCSVFTPENEGVANKLEAAFNLKRTLLKHVYGYAEGGDNLFIAGWVKR